MDSILLSCLLMDNNEIMFCWKSLWFLTNDQIHKYAFEQTQEWGLTKFITEPISNLN